MDSNDLAIRTIRYLAVSLSIAIGFGLVAVAAAVGDCSFAGGSCPSDPPPLVDDDTFRFAASGALLAVAVPVFAWRPSWRRLGIALGLGLAAAVVVGFGVRAGAHG